jgi:predicted O-linked N-acetylglucosamine transferase (SPINDLY family)
MIIDHQQRMPHDMQQAISSYTNGQMIEARKKCEFILNQNPNHPDALHLLGIIIGQTGQLSQAITLIQKAIDIHDKDSAYYSNLAIFLARKGECSKALEQYQKSLSLNAEDPGTFNNMAMALYAQKNFEQSILYFKKALELKPDYDEARIHLSMAFEASNQIGHAIQCCEYVIEQSTNKHLLAKAYNQLGNLWLKKASSTDAIESYKKALSNDNHHHQIWSNYLLTLNYNSEMTASQIYHAHQDWGQQIEKEFVPLSFHSNIPDVNRPIRVAYMSPDFRMHPVAFFIEPLLKYHDGRIIEVYCYEDVQKPDQMTKKLKQHQHKWIKICGHSNEFVSSLIQSDGIDILIDLSGHTAKNRLPVFARKPAPIQLSYLGYINTTGLKTMDYRLTDTYADSVHSKHLYSEKLVYLEPCFCCYQPPDISLNISDLPALSKKYITFGAFHNLAKVSPNTLELWAELLHAISKSKLVLQSISLSDHETNKRFRQYFQSKGIESYRIEFLGYQSFNEYLKKHHDIDIFLDTQPWSGHTVCCHALWMGIPVITMEGHRYAERMVGSILKTLNLNDWIAKTKAEYLQKAIFWSQNKEQLSIIRNSLRSQFLKSSVCDGLTFTRQIEMIYRQLWNKWCKVI